MTTAATTASRNYRRPTSTPSRNDCGCNDSGRTNQTQWSNTAVNNNKASIDLGDYKLDFNKSDSSMTMTNAKTGDTDEGLG